MIVTNSFLPKSLKIGRFSSGLISKNRMIRKWLESVPAGPMDGPATYRQRTFTELWEKKIQ